MKDEKEEDEIVKGKVIYIYIYWQEDNYLLIFEKLQETKLLLQT